MHTYIVGLRHYPLHYSELRRCNRLTTTLKIFPHATCNLVNVTEIVIFVDTLPNAYMNIAQPEYGYIAFVAPIIDAKLAMKDAWRNKYSKAHTHTDVHRQLLLQFLEQPQHFLSFF